MKKTRYLALNLLVFAGLGIGGAPVMASESVVDGQFASAKGSVSVPGFSQTRSNVFNIGGDFQQAGSVSSDLGGISYGYRNENLVGVQAGVGVSFSALGKSASVDVSTIQSLGGK